MLNRVARHAGIDHVHPHQLRHTLATQAINRGMSLEAVAAMLGHKTLRMTLVYARIADTTVAEAYDNVTDQVDALYTKPAGLRSTGDRHRVHEPARHRIRPTNARQRLLQPASPTRLPIRIDLRVLRLLLDRTPASPRSSKPNETTPPTETNTTESTSSNYSSTATTKRHRDHRLPP